MAYTPLFPKTDLTPLPIGADPTKWVDASDWNVVASGARNIHNIIDYGAISGPVSTARGGTVDCLPAFNAAIAAWIQTTWNPFTNVPTGGIYVPEGTWYVSGPIYIPTGCMVFGDGYLQSIIAGGNGDSTTPALVQAFSGPMIYVTGALAYPAGGYG